ncbi:hypothetical protein MZM54_00375 [[Brevibacterium] frigoritolerans]|nr:hypothetical protein [Peribacillus frigoritolerans]
MEIKLPIDRLTVVSENRLRELLDKEKRYEKAVQLALETLENNNLMNDDYRKIHSILDGE